jgi:hypothetical protein
VVGKPVYEFVWAGRETADKTVDDSLLVVKGKVGTVVKAVPEQNQVVILLESSFTSRRDFVESGVWMEIA